MAQDSEWMRQYRARQERAEQEYLEARLREEGIQRVNHRTTYPLAPAEGINVVFTTNATNTVRVFLDPAGNAPIRREGMRVFSDHIQAVDPVADEAALVNRNRTRRVSPENVKEQFAWLA